MQLLPFILVIVSIFSHAYWNYLIKSSQNKHIFTGLSKLAEVILFAIPAGYFLVTSTFQYEFLPLILVAASITFLNYFFLSSAYKYGELSMVYPISRSSVIFLPVIAYFFIDERIDVTGTLAILLIVTGTLVMHMESLDKTGFRAILKNMSSKGSIYALLAALTVAGYTLWDKVSITKMDPFLYFYLYTSIVAISYNLFIIKKYGKEALAKEWGMHRNRILQVGFFNSFTYLLILTALTMSKATYVGGLRQLSVVIGALLGYKLLNETLKPPKLVGIAISIFGGLLIYFSK